MDASLFLINIVYVIAAGLFIYGIKLLSHPATARKGNRLSALGMLLAVCFTLLHQDIIGFTFLFSALLLGAIVGAVAAKRVPMTAMPELVSLFNGIGGLASALVAWAMLNGTSDLTLFIMVVGVVAVIIGCITFSGSLIAWGKLSQRLPGRPMVFQAHAMVNALLALAVFLFGYLVITFPSVTSWQLALTALALLLGVLFVLPIGGADMPVVISLLNSFSGLAACAAGLALENNLLIVAGALVGASGTILTIVMCKGMNRTLWHVMTSGLKVQEAMQMKLEGEVKAINPDDAYYLLEAARSVVVVPGYGLAVAQAQHALKELQELLEANDTLVSYAIHPVAGRMPGHMNVLLAEADVSYEQLFEMDDINPRMASFDVAVIIGANDVVNPAAREMAGSPIYGMPVIHADEARNVLVLKRSMATGFAGVENPLFLKPNCSMIFGDAKETLGAIIRQFSD